MLSRNWLSLFVAQQLKSSTDSHSSGVWLDDVVDESSGCHRKWIAKLVNVFLLVLLGVLLPTVQNRHCTLGSHHCHFGRWPGIVDIGFQMLRTHHIIRATVSFTRDYRNLWHGRLRKCVQQLCSVSDDATVLLGGSRKETCGREKTIKTCIVRLVLPGTSTNVKMGMLNASQNRTKRAPFTEELMSRHPATYLGLFPTIPTVSPFILAKPTRRFLAKSGMISKKSLSSTI